MTSKSKTTSRIIESNARLLQQTTSAKVIGLLDGLSSIANSGRQAVTGDRKYVRPILIGMDSNVEDLEVSANVIHGDIQLFEGRGTFKDVRFIGNKQFVPDDDKT